MSGGEQKVEGVYYRGIPELYYPALRLLEKLRDVILYPADSTDRPITVDSYGARQTLDALSDDVNPGRFYLLDQYLASEFLLRNLFGGQDELITNDNPAFPRESPFTMNLSEPWPLIDETDYQELSQNLKSLTNVPSDRSPDIERLGIIINRAHEARAFELGVSGEKYPSLEYPSGFGTIPQLISIAHSTQDIPARIFLHRVLQNRLALQVFKNSGQAALTDKLSPIVAAQDNFPTLPSDELMKQVASWANHLKQGWAEVSEDQVIEKGKDITGLPVQVNVKGWARLSVDYDFAHLARKKLSVLYEQLMKVTAKIFEDPEFELPEVFDDDSIGNDPKSWESEFFLPEFRLLNSIFYELYKNAEQLLASEICPIPPDQEPSIEWFEAVRSDPDVIELSPEGHLRDVPGIVTDIESDDITNPGNFGFALIDPIHNEVITPERQYSIYVHPLIWDEIRQFLGSDMKLSRNYSYKDLSE